MKIILDKSKCIGCGSCTALCPKIFELGEDGKAHIKEARIEEKTENEELEVEKLDCAKEAAEACPVQAIQIK